MFSKKVSLIAGILGLTQVSYSQYQNIEDYKSDYNAGKILNTITTAVPFLGISPDARAGGMGDLGVATEADANSMHWNLSKIAFGERRTNIALSYSPWLRNLIPDVNLAYLSFYQKIGKQNRMAFSGSLRYFSLGNIQFTDVFGQPIGNYNPNEFAIDAGYAMKLSEKLSMAVAFRFTHSNLTLGQFVQGAATFPGNAGSGDISLFYENKDKTLFKMPITYRFGAAISNLGSKIRYSETSRADFLPMALRLGPSFQIAFDDYNTLMWSVEISKLLAPTMPIYATDSTGQRLKDPAGNDILLGGMDPGRGVMDAMITSFGDAPGGLKEEFHEYMIATGLEYWYAKQFAVRAGYFNEAKQKGNRKYFTLGLGVRYSAFGLDVSYLIPVVQRNPLENTLRFTLSFAFDRLQNNGKDNENPLPGRKKKNT
jgi:hypothetical protein